MAEAREIEETLPQKGKVEQVCKEWLVHEDGAMAYQLQNEENNFHYGLNRHNRRTVREDIPVAKFVQSEEEKRLQQERMRQLEQLKQQAERDAEIAKIVAEKENEQVRRKCSVELDDEAIARQMQEKEKKKYERYLEKKKEKELKKKREKLERELAQQTEQARITHTSELDDHGTERLNGSVDRLSLEDNPANSQTRVTPAGQIEDNGDFSDFYALPPGDDNDPVRRHIQESQDEELARLLQEQEHKRNKAEVDKDKLKAIEVQDEELARVIQEQEKLKARKAKLKRQQLKEQKLQEQQTQSQQVAQTGERVRNAKDRPLPPVDSDQPPYPHRYRRDSYTRSISNNSAPVQQSPAAITDSSQHFSDEEQWYNVLEDADITSARELTRARELSSGRIPPQDYTHRVVPREQNGAPKPATQSTQRHNTDHRSTGEVSDPAVERWLAQSVPSRSVSHTSSATILPPSPSPPGSYHSEEESQEHFGSIHTSQINHSGSGNQTFNIAAAIDPTYKRRQHELDESNEQTHPKPLAFSRSLPVEDTEVEWDPAGLRGSLRRPKGQWNPSATNYQDSSTLSSLRSDLESPCESGPVMNPFQPVQGQRRSTLEHRRKAPSSNKSGKSGGSCKQQ